MALLDEEAKEDFSFSRGIKTIYTAENAVQQLRDWGNGKIKPEGTVLDLMKKIDDLVGD